MIDNTKVSICVLFTDSARTDRCNPFNKKNTSRVYTILSKKAEQHGLNLFIAYHEEYKDGKLKSCWYRNKDKWKLVKDQDIDIVYSRFAGSIYKDNKRNHHKLNFKYKMAEQVTLINNPIIDEFCWDKKIVSEIFHEYTPNTFLVNTINGLKTILPELKSDKIVIKPRYGTLGHDVIITEKDKLPEKIERNTLVQEFIDTSKGIDGVIKGYHDLRVIIINGKVDHAHIRTPKKGFLAANVALGGKKIFIKNEHIPKKALFIAKKVDRLFKHIKPRMYSIDFLIDNKGRAYIVECNSQPMIDKYAFGKYADLNFYDRLFDCIKSSAKIRIINTI